MPIVQKAYQNASTPRNENPNQNNDDNSRDTNNF